MINFIAGFIGGGLICGLFGLVVGVALTACEPPRYDRDGPDTGGDR